MKQHFDVIVIGGGHAGIEASSASARLGANVLLVTLDVDNIGRMSCNPAIGGLAKGQLAREIDALGGLMGLIIDATGIQFRILNTKKGPAVQSPRAQADKSKYIRKAIELLNQYENLKMLQSEAVELILEEQKDNSKASKFKVKGIKTDLGDEIIADAVVLTSGTFMRGLLHFGEVQMPGGRTGAKSADKISPFLEKLGFNIKRLKTGTPPRIDARTVDFSKMKEQKGDANPEPFSFRTPKKTFNPTQLSCFLTRTNENAHKVILSQLNRVPLYSGQIKAVGPRYCPSIEDKVVKFADKTGHQIFLEPEGQDTTEMYANGIATSIPIDMQQNFIREIEGLENAKIIRYGYAVEYDFIPAYQVSRTLETYLVENFYLAGQILGTSGYEEAGAQGLIAGANAALKIAGKAPLILTRDEAYIGVLIDDLISVVPSEPYRMFTSRAEFRLLLRADNADRRLTKQGANAGLISKEQILNTEKKEKAILELTEIIKKTAYQSENLYKFLKRPEAQILEIKKDIKDFQNLDYSDEIWTQAEIDIKYEGYIVNQLKDVERLHKLEMLKIPENFDYDKIPHLRFEARQRLKQIKPDSIRQASRLEGVTPADVAILIANIATGKPRE